MDFCVECGAEEKLYGHLCKNCLLSKELVKPPKHLTLTVCRGCDSVQKGSSWQDLRPADIAFEMLARETVARPEVTELKWELPDFEPEKGEQKINAKVIASVGGEELELDFEILVKIQHQMCDSCSRQRGNYFETILQLRGESVIDANETVLNAIDELGKNDNYGFLSKQEKVTGGVDYYLGSAAMARTIAKRFKETRGAGITESSSLVGQKDGRDTHRWTILIRLPAVKAGDVVESNKILYAVESVRASHITLRHLMSGQKLKIKSGDQDLKTVAKKEEVEDAVVVSADSDSIQILDPHNMKTVTLSRPSCLHEIGETVKVFRYKDELFIL